MGKGDGSVKMRRLKAQKKKKLREKAKIAVAKGSRIASNKGRR